MQQFRPLAGAPNGYPQAPQPPLPGGPPQPQGGIRPPAGGGVFGAVPQFAPPPQGFRPAPAPMQQAPPAPMQQGPPVPMQQGPSAAFRPAPAPMQQGPPAPMQQMPYRPPPAPMPAAPYRPPPVPVPKPMAPVPKPMAAARPPSAPAPVLAASKVEKKTSLYVGTIPVPCSLPTHPGRCAHEASSPRSH